MMRGEHCGCTIVYHHHTMSEQPAVHHVTWREALRTFAIISIHSFGGPAGQIAVMHRVLVDEKKWLDERRFLHALNYCMLLPGPEAMQLATYAGWLLHGTRGGLMAGTLFVLPGFLSILALSLFYSAARGLTVTEGVLLGLKAAVLAIVVEALIRIARRVLKNVAMFAIAAAAFVAIFLFRVPFPVIIAVAALVGILGGRLAPRAFPVPNSDEAAIIDSATRDAPPPFRTLSVLAIWLPIWLGPVALLHLFLGPDHVFAAESLFFSKAAVVTFGGAYAVLAYVAQQAVEVYAWLEPGEMLTGLGFAETTPGPLIQVVQFVGYMGAYRDPGLLHPMLAGVIASVIVTWVTFVPCFLWVFLGAPYVERLRGVRWLASALAAITAAVCGVILNLALYFALHTLFADLQTRPLFGLHLPVPDLQTIHWGAAGISLLSGYALLARRWGVMRVLALAVTIGIALSFLESIR